MKKWNMVTPELPTYLFRKMNRVIHNVGKWNHTINNWDLIVNYSRKLKHPNTRRNHYHQTYGYMLIYVCEALLITRETFNAPFWNDINVFSRLLYFLIREMETKKNPTKPSFYNIETRVWGAIALGRPPYPRRRLDMSV